MDKRMVGKRGKENGARSKEQVRAIVRGPAFGHFMYKADKNAHEALPVAVLSRQVREAMAQARKEAGKKAKRQPRPAWDDMEDVLMIDGGGAAHWRDRHGDHNRDGRKIPKSRVMTLKRFRDIQAILPRASVTYQAEEGGRWVFDDEVTVRRVVVALDEHEGRWRPVLITYFSYHKMEKRKRKRRKQK